MDYQLTDQKVRRVLECLRDQRRKTSGEIVQLYNQLYPPPLIGKYARRIGIETKERELVPILLFLVGMQYVEKHIMSFTDEPHEIPLIQYSLTKTGFQYLNSLR